ncbi:MAG: hypothetical protein ACREBW_06725 [Candidatus Micrarchaeaceae archaeon]
MNTDPDFAILFQKFFTERLIRQRFASPNTIKAYRDTFHLLLRFTEKQLRKEPSKLDLAAMPLP